MYPSGKPYPRLLPPVFLSPIEELEENVQFFTTGNFTQSECSIVELNNSSLIRKEISKTSSCTTEDSRHGRNNRSQIDREHIESCSGRKIADVEFVKQKYINSEIQDLPRLLCAPFRCSLIHRTRSTHLNLGSQDIRNQMNKIRLKSRFAHMLPETRLEYRCKKYKEPSKKYARMQKSMREILYGDFYNTDDFDPELAALFENYIEECDKTKMEPVKHFSPYPTDCSTTQKEEEDSASQFELDTERAFMCGYIEGLKQVGKSQDPSESEKSMNENDVKGETQPEIASHKDMISSQQDITHIYLREWEQENRLEQQQRKSGGQKLFEDVLQCDKVQTKETENKHENNSVSAEKQNQRSTDLKEASFTIADDQNGDAKDNEKKRSAVSDALHGRNSGSNTDIRPESKEDFSKSLCLKDFKEGKFLVQSKSSSSITRCRSCNKPKYNTAPPSNQSENYEKLVRFPKQKLEHKMLTTRALEETCSSTLKSINKITNDCKPYGSRISRNDPKGPKISVSKVEAKGTHIGSTIMGELDGWETEIKAFNDHDNVQMSSSGILHPVDSFENVYSPNRMWTPSSSAPPCTPVDQQMQIADEIEHKLKSLASKASITVTSISATLSDSKSLCCSKKAHGSKLSKQGLGISSDYKNAANSVKLRLTKSSDSVGTNGKPFVGKSVANVPLSQCVSYSIEQNLRSGTELTTNSLPRTQLTTNINLSEKLAQQLKELSCKSRKGSLRDQDGLLSGCSTRITLTQSTAKPLPSISDSAVSLDGHGDIEDIVTENVCLPNIRTPAAVETGPRTTTLIPRQKDQAHNTFEQELNKNESIDLPQILVRSFPARTPQKVCNKTAKTQEDEGHCGNRGIPVRTGVCTSSYMFDKEDPSVLHLTAQALLPLHSVCTSCGRIYENQEITDKAERKSKTICKVNNSKNKQIHTHCCDSCFNDKWILDKKRFDQNADLPAVSVEKIETARTPKALQPQDGPAPQMAFSPTLTKQGCEEMSINFMHKNIKFRFQCDVSVENSEETADKPSTITAKWLSSLSTPQSKERYQCPVTTETRIYKNDFKKMYNSQHSEPQTHASSPYLGFCKFRAEMQAKRNEKIHDKLEFLSDTALTDEVYLRAASKTRFVPVIPKKKRKDCFKSMNKYAATSATSPNPNSPRKTSDIDLTLESTKPARLPLIQCDPFSSDNTNNNGQARDRFFGDVHGYSLAFKMSIVLCS